MVISAGHGGTCLSYQHLRQRQMVRVLATEPADLNSISGSHMVEAENQPYKLSSDLDKGLHMDIYGHTHKEREERVGGWMDEWMNGWMDGLWA